MKIRAIYPGTFDPITNGHLDLISRAATLFPNLLIGVAVSQEKKPFFDVAQRVALVQEAVKPFSGVHVLSFNQLLVDFAREQQAHFILRGIRAGADFDYELQLAQMNKHLSGAKIETVFLGTSEQVQFISSTLVREIAKLGGDVTAFVPACVAKAFYTLRA